MLQIYIIDNTIILFKYLYIPNIINRRYNNNILIEIDIIL